MNSDKTERVKILCAKRDALIEIIGDLWSHETMRELEDRLMEIRRGLRELDETQKDGGKNEGHTGDDYKLGGYVRDYTGHAR